MNRPDDGSRERRGADWIRSGRLDNWKRDTQDPRKISRWQESQLLLRQRTSLGADGPMLAEVVVSEVQLR